MKHFPTKIGVRSLLRKNMIGNYRPKSTLKNLYDSYNWEHSGWNRSTQRSWKNHRRYQWKSTAWGKPLNHALYLAGFDYTNFDFDFDCYEDCYEDNLYDDIWDVETEELDIAYARYGYDSPPSQYWTDVDLWNAFGAYDYFDKYKAPSHGWDFESVLNYKNMYSFYGLTYGGHYYDW